VRLRAATKISTRADRGDLTTGDLTTYVGLIYADFGKVETDSENSRSTEEKPPSSLSRNQRAI